MLKYDRFKERFHEHKKVWHQFTENELNVLDTKLPTAIREFLTAEGLSSYSNNFLWTTLPGDFHDVLSSWGLKGKACHAFLRSAFGACVFYNNEEYYYLDPLEGRVVSLGNDVYLMMNYMLTLDAILDPGFFHDYFLSIKADPKLLDPESIFGFSPPFPSGGNFKKSSVEIVNMTEHITSLAKLFGGKAKRIK